MTEIEQHEPHELDTEIERETRNDTLCEVMDQFELRGEPVPGWIGAMMLPVIECCPEIEAAKKELWNDLHNKTGDHFK